MRSEERGENRLRSFRVGKHDILVTREITNPSVIPPRKVKLLNESANSQGKVWKVRFISKKVKNEILARGASRGNEILAAGAPEERGNTGQS